MMVGEKVYLIRSLSRDEPKALMLGPVDAQTRDLEDAFVSAVDGGAYILENARFNDDSFNRFIDWLTRTQGFRHLPWEECAA